MTLYMRNGVRKEDHPIPFSGRHVHYEQVSMKMVRLSVFFVNYALVNIIPLPHTIIKLYSFKARITNMKFPGMWPVRELLTYKIIAANPVVIPIFPSHAD